MAKIIEFFKQKWVIQLLGLIAISVLIWFLGPLIAIADWVPLKSPAVRLIVILVLTMLWMGILLIGYVKAQKTDRELVDDISKGSEDENSESSEEELGLINERFDEAIQVIKKTGKGKKRVGTQYLYELPWYIIIGPPGSGKTTALVNSGLQFPLADKLGMDAIRGVGGTRNCDWWFTDNAVLLDTAGRYTTQDSHAAVDATTWQGFLELLKKHRKRRPINGALIAISLLDLLTHTPEERSLHARAIRNRIQELHEKLDIDFPIYLLFTKSDLVAGFNEFFGSLGADERKQVWGATFGFENEKSAEGSAANFASEYDALLERINERMITKIHQERDVAKRSQIFGFPQQMANLKSPIEQFLNEAFLPNRFEKPPLLRGFYFTSGTQEGTPIDRLMGSVASAFGLDRSSQPTFSGQGRSYFIHNLFRKVIFAESDLVGTDIKYEKRRRWLQRAVYAAAVVILGLGILLWFTSFTRNQITIDELETEIAQYQGGVENLEYQQTNFSKLLPPLNHLRQAAHIYPEDVPLLMGAGLYQGDRLQPTAEDSYQRVLKGRFLFSIGKRLEDLIEVNIEKPEVLSLVLKSYLMLGEPSRLEKEEVKLLMGVDWSNSLGGDQNRVDELNQHLESLLAKNFEPLPLNLALVTQARSTLTRTRLSDQIYGRIKSDTQSHAPFDLELADIFGNKADIVIKNRKGDLDQLKVSGLYTTLGFQKVFLKEYKDLSSTADQAFWVRGEDKLSASGESQMNVLEKELLELYVDDYIQQWRSLLSNIQIKRLSNLSSAIEILDAASGSFSPIRKILQAVEANTNLLRAKTEFETPVSQGNQDKLSAATDAAALITNSTTIGTRQQRLEKLIGTAGAFSENSADTVMQRVDDTFAKLSKLVRKRGDDPAPIDSLLSELFNLYTFLSDLEASGSTGRAALEAMKSDRNPGRQLQRKTKSLPEPLRSWLEGFSEVSQDAVASRSQNQLSQVWGADVIPFCKRGIDGRYPLNKDSRQDITVEDFSRFFAPGQMLDQYFTQYIQPFVDTSFNPWRWREGKRPSISNASLAQFEAANQIRNAFFREGGQPTVRFSLKPVQLDSSVLKFSLSLGNQNLSYRHGPTVTSNFTWPATSGGGTARIQFQTADGKTTGASSEGPWGWFKLLDKANLESTENADKYLLTFELEGQKASFELFASSVNNPFDLAALKRFKCRSRL